MGTAAAATISDKAKVTLGFGSLFAILAAASLAYARIASAEAQILELRPRVDRLDREREGAALRLQRIEDKLDTLSGVVGDIKRDLRDSTRTAVGGR